MVGTVLVGVDTKESSAGARFGLTDNMGGAGGVEGGGVDAAEDEVDDLGTEAELWRGSLEIGSLDCGILARWNNKSPEYQYINFAYLGDPFADTHGIGSLLGQPT